MSDAAGETPQPATEPTAPAVDPDWFDQISFNPRKGLNSVLPMELPDALPDSQAADAAAARADHG
ncbi:hypothetical protein [Jatrophihabitans sp.]|jgi:hypothetical protein|uniref:hypothetical protein n=1 Tax=Jatrophihabitans sp. TaxID=1932789 RepID=UPI002F04AD11